MKTFISNTKKSKIINLVYKMVNVMYGNNATITRNSLGKAYKLNKFDINISLSNDSIYDLEPLIVTCLDNHGVYNIDGVTVNIMLHNDATGKTVLNFRVS